MARRWWERVMGATILGLLLVIGSVLPAAATEIGAGVRLTWLGQAGFRMESGGDVVIVDPWGAAAGFPGPSSVNDATAVLITHGHFDHLDTVLLGTIRAARPTTPFVGIFEIATYLNSQGLGALFSTLLPMSKGGTHAVGGVKATMVDAVHSSGIGNIFIGEAPHEKTGGEAAGYIIEFANGFRVYHAGDTDAFGGMELIRKRYHPDLALLPIGGIFTMDPEGAALAVSVLRPKFVIPMHYAGTFGLPGSPEDFRRAVRKRVGNSVKVIVIAPGESVE